MTVYLMSACYASVVIFLFLPSWLYLLRVCPMVEIKCYESTHYIIWIFSKLHRCISSGCFTIIEDSHVRCSSQAVVIKLLKYYIQAHFSTQYLSCNIIFIIITDIGHFIINKLFMSTTIFPMLLCLVCFYQNIGTQIQVKFSKLETWPCFLFSVTRLM